MAGGALCAVVSSEYESVDLALVPRIGKTGILGKLFTIGAKTDDQRLSRPKQTSQQN